MGMNFLPRWVTSDHHFLHDNIVGFCRRPGHEDGDTQRHNHRMRNNWINTVRPTDTILHLGDLVLGSRADAEALLGGKMELPGRKFLLKGNHDKRSRSFYESLGFEIVDPFDLEVNGYRVFFSHYPLIPPVKTLGEGEINLMAHVHNSYVPGLTQRHVNVGVDMNHLYPVDTMWHIENAIRRCEHEDRVRDYMPAGKDLEPLDE